MNDVMFRQLNRLSLCLPVRVSLRSRPRNVGPSIWQMNPEVEHTVTENVSSGGCYFFLSQEPPVETRLEMEITVPGEIPDVPFARIYCLGKVIRVEPRPADPTFELPRFGVAAAIERLHDVNLDSIPAPTGHAAAGPGGCVAQ
jgi:hypothetical protein